MRADVAAYDIKSAMRHAGFVTSLINKTVTLLLFTPFKQVGPLLTMTSRALLKYHFV